MRLLWTLKSKGFLKVVSMVFSVVFSVFGVVLVWFFNGLLVVFDAAQWFFSLVLSDFCLLLRLLFAGMQKGK